MADVITEATIRFVQEGADETEQAVAKARREVRAAGADAQSTAGDFDTWLDKIGNLSQALDEDLNSKYQKLFLATDRLNSITGAATGAFELFSLAGQGLAFVVEAVTQAEAEAAQRAAEYNRQLELQKQRADEAAAALQGLAAATQGDALDVRLEQTIAYAKAQQDLNDAQEAYNQALGDRIALDRAQPQTIVGERLARAGVRFVEDLKAAEAEVEKLTVQWNRIDRDSRSALTAALNSAVARRNAIVEERDRQEEVVRTAAERVEAAKQTLDRIKDTAREERDLGDIANEVVLAQIEQEKQQEKVTAAVRASVTEMERFQDIMASVSSSGAFARVLESNPVAELARREQEEFDGALQEMLETEAFVADEAGDVWGQLARDLDKHSKLMEATAKRTAESFEAFYSGVGAGAAGALIDVALFGANLQDRFNALLQVITREAGVEALMELGRGFRDLALGLPTAGLHFTSAGYFGAVGAVAGIGAALTGGLGGETESAGVSAPSPASPTQPGSFRRDTGDGPALGDTVINVNFVAGRRPTTRRERREFADATRRMGAA